MSRAPVPLFMATHDGHRQRLKQRFYREGLDHFEAHNALELFLFASIPRKDTNDLAHLLLDTFGSLAAVFDAPLEELKKVPGIGESTAFLIKLLPEMSRLYIEDKYKDNSAINSTEKAGNFLKPKFIGRTDEVAMIIAMDGKCRVLHCAKVSEGTVNEVVVNVRKVVEICMKFHASYAILAHNHPNGIAIPSSTDEETTFQVKRALSFVGIRLVDHFVIADNDYVSMAQSRKYRYIFEEQPEGIED